MMVSSLKMRGGRRQRRLAFAMLIVDWATEVVAERAERAEMVVALLLKGAVEGAAEAAVAQPRPRWCAR
jgi:hypothetical protein